MAVYACNDGLAAGLSYIVNENLGTMVPASSSKRAGSTLPRNLGTLTVTLILSFVGLSLAACGGPSATPSGPTHRPAIVAAASAPFALVGESVMLTARNTETGELLPVVWQNQTPTFAAISGSTLTVLQHGRVRVRAEYNGAMSDLDLRGIANFNGWYPRSDPDGRTLIYGQAHLVECLTGNPLSPCANVTPGREEDLTLRLAQVGEEVSGYVYMQFG